MEQRILIIGGGFAGVGAALRLARKRLPNTKITVVSDRSHFEYQPALYRLVTGTSPLEVCIPLREVFKGTSVDVIEDRIIELNREQKIAKGTSGSQYKYDYLVLTLGSETNFFNIPGLEERSFGMKSIKEALKLKRHITQVLASYPTQTKEDQMRTTHFVIIGAGPTGVEMSANLIEYTRKLALKYAIDPHLITIDLIEAAPRILPQLPEEFTKRIEHHLRGLGVNIFANRAIEREGTESVYLKDMELQSKTVIWTAGVKANRIYQDWGFEVDTRGRVEIDEYFQPKGMENIFVGGDAAVATFWGMAQTAYDHGIYIANVIGAKINSRMFTKFTPKEPVYAIPVGTGWAGVLWGKKKFYGTIGWWLRRSADLVAFNLILPPLKALDVFRTGASISKSCKICLEEEKNSGVM